MSLGVAVAANVLRLRVEAAEAAVLVGTLYLLLLGLLQILRFLSISVQQGLAVLRQELTEQAAVRLG
jgi:hypothetical protein